MNPVRSTKTNDYKYTRQFLQNIVLFKKRALRLSNDNPLLNGMKNTEIFIKRMIELMGFDDYNVELNEEHRHGRIFIYSNQTLVKENLPVIIESINHLSQLVAKKENSQPIFFDVNNYRRERENIITELARAAARKAVATKQEISLPTMNSYERRIIHVELAGRPDVLTESVGAGKSRYVIVKPIKEGGFEKKEAAARDEISE